MIEKCRKIGSNIIDLIAVLLIGFVFIANLLRTCRVSYDDAEVVSYSTSTSYVFFVLILLLSVYCYLRITTKIDIESIIKGFSIIYIIAGLYIIFNTTPFIRADAATVWGTAKNFLDGDFSGLLKENYIGLFPFQLGMVTYDEILQLFTENENILYAANLLEILIINWFGYKITNSLFHNDTANRIAVFLEFAFIPQFLFLMFGYGLIPGFCCFILAVYFCIRIHREWNLKDVICLIGFSTLASLIKPNFKIGIIAIVIVLVLKQCETFKVNYKLCITALLVLLCSVGAFNLMKLTYSSISGIKIGDGTPMLAHIAMGTDLDNEVRAPGWFDGYTFSAYSDAHYNTQLATQNTRAKIKVNISESVNDPTRAMSFYWRKILSTWCEPMFQSAWSGPFGEDLVATPCLISLYSGKSVEKNVALFSKANVIIILVLSLCFILKRRKDYPAARILYLYFIGGFIFHLFSETKSQYVYMYIFLMIPIAAYELNQALKYLRSKKKSSIIQPKIKDNSHL